MLPSWKYEPLSTLADPIKTELRHLGFLQLVHYYGGVLVPDSFLCQKSLLPWYQSTKQSPCIAERLNRTLTNSDQVFIPSPYFLSAHKNNEIIRAWISEYELQFDNAAHCVASAESALITHPESTSQMVQQGKIAVLDGERIGIKQPNGKPILLEDLLTENYLNLSTNIYGIYIPADEILVRTNWKWFAYMSEEQILSSNTILAKYFMASTVIEIPNNIKNQKVDLKLKLEKLHDDRNTTY